MTFVELAAVLGNLGEFIASIGVLITLFYLAIQIRQNTQTLRHIAYQEATRDQVTLSNMVSSDAELNRIVYEGMEDFELLSRDDKRRFESYLVSNLRMLENLLFEVERGRIDSAEWAGIRGHQDAIISSPGFAQWWHRRSRGVPRADLFNLRLQRFVEERAKSTNEGQSGVSIQGT